VLMSGHIELKEIVTKHVNLWNSCISHVRITLDRWRQIRAHAAEQVALARAVAKTEAKEEADLTPGRRHFNHLQEVRTAMAKVNDLEPTHLDIKYVEYEPVGTDDQPVVCGKKLVMYPGFRQWHCPFHGARPGEEMCMEARPTRKRSAVQESNGKRQRIDYDE